MSREITDNAAELRYEASEDGVLAGFAEYRAEPGAVAITHTKVDPEFEGRGIGGALARFALDDVRSRGLKVRPLCPFIASWIEKHPDYADLVA